MTAAKPKRRRARPPGALILIAGCFAASALLRVTDPSGSLARAAASIGGEDGPAVEAPAQCEMVDDPTGLLATLRERERQLDARAAEIADRERLLDVAEAKFQEQLEALRTAEEKLAATIAVAASSRTRFMKTTADELPLQTTIFRSSYPVRLGLTTAGKSLLVAPSTFFTKA